MLCIHANPQFTSVPAGGKAEFRQNQLVREEPQSRINHCFCTSLAVPEGHLTDLWAEGGGAAASFSMVISATE